MPEATNTDTQRKITITTPQNLAANKSITYRVVKIFNATTGGNKSDPVSYTRLGDWQNDIKSTDSLSRFHIDGSGYIHYQERHVTSDTGTTPVTYSEWADSAVTTTLSQGLVEALRDTVKNVNYDQTNTVRITGPNASKTVVVPEYGYYYITSTTGTAIAIDTTHPNAIITDKNIVPEIDKKVTGGDASTPSDSNTADVGDELTYTVTIKAKKGAQSYEFKDRLGRGLTLGKKEDLSITADGKTLQESTDYRVSFEDNIGRFIIDFSANFLNTLTQGLENNESKDIVITYKAKVNSDALTLDSTKNKASLGYGEQSGYVINDEVETKLYGFNLKKVDSTDDNTTLDNVQFTLPRGTGDALEYYSPTVTGDDSHWIKTAPVKKDDDTYTGAILTTTNGGKLSANGVEAGTYTLTEVKTNDGYNLLTQPIYITIDNNGNLTSTGAVNITADQNVVAKNSAATANAGTTNFTLKVQNTRGALLPSTGGIGTTVFYEAGGALIVLAAVMILKERKNH